MTRQEKLFLEDNEAVTREKDAAYIEAKEQAVRGKIAEIDRIINENTEGWNTTRMGKVELTVLRLAIYEMLYDDDIPCGRGHRRGGGDREEIRTGKCRRFCQCGPCENYEAG